MTYKVVISARANRQLRKISEYITDNASAATADRFVDDVVDYCMGFDLFPMRGVARDDLRPGVRIVGFNKRASIAFTVGTDTVTIMEVFYLGRNYDDSLPIGEP